MRYSDRAPRSAGPTGTRPERLRPTGRKLLVLLFLLSVAAGTAPSALYAQTDRPELGIAVIGDLLDSGPPSYFGAGGLLFLEYPVAHHAAARAELQYLRIRSDTERSIRSGLASLGVAGRARAGWVDLGAFVAGGVAFFGSSSDESGPIPGAPAVQGGIGASLGGSAPHLFVEIRSVALFTDGLSEDAVVPLFAITVGWRFRL